MFIQRSKEKDNLQIASHPESAPPHLWERTTWQLYTWLVLVYCNILYIYICFLYIHYYIVLSKGSREYMYGWSTEVIGGVSHLTTDILYILYIHVYTTEYYKCYDWSNDTQKVSHVLQASITGMILIRKIHHHHQYGVLKEGQNKLATRVASHHSASTPSSRSSSSIELNTRRLHGGNQLGLAVCHRV